MANKFTEKQLGLLRLIPDKDYVFPKGSAVGMCERLESMGLVTGKLMMVLRDNRRGITQFARAYKRTPGGKACVKNNEKFVRKSKKK